MATAVSEGLTAEHTMLKKFAYFLWQASVK